MTIQNLKFETPAMDEWMLVTDKAYRMNKHLERNLRYLENSVRYDNDAIVIVDGREGAGKSCFAQQIGYFLHWLSCQHWKQNPNWSVKNVVFTPEEFREGVLKAEKHECIIWDEAFVGNSKFNMSSKTNMTIMSLLQQIRQKNLFIVIVLPYIFDLNQYLARTRSWYLCHVFLRSQADFLQKGEELDIENKPIFLRGFFEFYNFNSKHLLYGMGRKEYVYNVPSDFEGMFPSTYTVNEADYKEKKKNIKAAGDDDPKKLKLDERAWIQACLERKMKAGIISEFAKEYSHGSIMRMQSEYHRELRKLENQNQTQLIEEGEE